MVFVGIIFLELLGYTLALRVFLGVPLAAGPAIYAAAIMVSLYVFDFIGSLRIASQFIHAGGLLALATSVAMMLRSPLPEFRIDAKNIARGIAVLLCAFLAVSFLYLMNERASFERWDEFSHWGTVIRAVYEAGTFHIHPNPLYFQDYPPGVSLFSYHLLILTGYSEGLAFFSCALLLLCFSFGAPGVALRLGIAPFLIACYLVDYAVKVFGVGWSSVLIDHLLGAGFAACILTYFIAREASKGLFAVPVVLGALVLVKSAGAMLAILAATIGVMDLLIIRYSSSGGLRQMRISAREFSWMIAMFAVPWVVNRSWYAYVVSEGLDLGWIRYSPFNVVQNVLACCNSSREIEVGSKFFAQIFNVSPSVQSPSSLFAFFIDALSRISLSGSFGGSQWSPAAVMAALLLAGGVMAAVAPGRLCRQRILALTLLIFLGFLGYLASLLLAYLYAFSDYEGRILMSFPRYLNVLFLGWFLISLAIAAMLAATMLRSSRPLARWAVAACAVLAIGVFFAIKPSLLSSSLTGMAHPQAAVESIRSMAPARAPYRAEVASFTDRIKPQIPKDAKVYIVWQRSNGLHLFVAKYELLPHFTNLYCWSLGDAPDVGMRPCQWSVAELSARLAPFDYIAVGRGLAELRQQYGDFFSDGPADGDSGLYRIQKLGDRLSLAYVAP